MSTKSNKKPRNCSKDIVMSMGLLKKDDSSVSRATAVTKQSSLLNFFSPVAKQGELYDTYCEPADENAVQEPNDIQVVACPLEVDHNENKQCVNSNKACNANTASACMSDDDHLSQIVRHVEVLSHFSCQANDKSDVTVECQFDSTEISETLAAADTSIASVSNSQYNAFTLSDSYCGTECELSQSQRLQLTNTQKLKMFAMELHMMNVPAMTHSSQNSLFDSLTDMSAMLT